MIILQKLESTNFCQNETNSINHIVMRKVIFIVLIIPFALNTWTCSTKNNQENMFPKVSEIKVSYELVSNNIAVSPKFLSKFILENQSDVELGNSGWMMYYNLVTRLPITESVPDIVKIEHVNGDFFRMAPTERFSLAPGESVEIFFESEAWLIKKSDAPSGVYFVYSDSKGEEVVRIPVDDINILPLTKPDQINRHRDDQTPIPTAEWQYEENKKLALLAKDELLPVIPTPVELTKRDGTVTLGENLMIHHEANLRNEATMLAIHLADVMGKKPMVMESQVSGPGIIKLQTGQVKANGTDKEAYTLEIDPDEGVIITGSDPAGVFYGIQSLIALFPVESFASSQSTLELASVKISDAPAFGYRGMHLDVGRNFQSKETVLKFLDVMAFYKMNT